MSKRKSELPASDDEHDEDKRTRHVPALELEGVAALSVAALSTPPPLYYDVLAVVFSFLTFVELTRACVCRAWHYAAIKMPCRVMERQRYGNRIPANILQCHVAQRHIRTWVELSREVVASVTDMQALTAFLPDLDYLDINVHNRTLHPTIPQLFATGIKTLRLYVMLTDEQWSWPAGNQLMETICALCKLEVLVLTVRANRHYTNRVDPGPGGVLQPLARLPNLARLEIGWLNFDDDQRWSDESIDVLRGLPALTELKMRLSNLAYFLRTPHALKLHTLDGEWVSRVNIGDTQWIESLPCLDELQSPGFFFHDPSFLGRLPGLTRLDLDLMHDSLPLDPILAALANCASLTHLGLNHKQFNGTALENMIRSHPTALASLTSLTFYVHGFDEDTPAFEFLVRVPLFKRQLRQLTLEFYGRPFVPDVQFQPLFALHELRELQIVGPLRYGLHIELQHACTPSSRDFRVDCFPHLRTFSYYCG